MEKMWVLPQFIGPIYESHVRSVVPQDYKTDYFNRKGWHSLIYKGVVDGERAVLKCKCRTSRKFVSCSSSTRRCRAQVLIAFGRLMGRWHCLMKKKMTAKVNW